MDTLVKRISTLFGRKPERRNITTSTTDESTQSNLSTTHETVNIQGNNYNSFCKIVLNNLIEPKYIEDDLTRHLPVDVIKVIFSFLKPQDLSTLCLVNRFWRTLSSDNSLWKSLIETELTDPQAYENLMYVTDSNFSNL
jgi:hypothetical protein